MPRLRSLSPAERLDLLLYCSPSMTITSLSKSKKPRPNYPSAARIATSIRAEHSAWAGKMTALAKSATKQPHADGGLLLCDFFLARSTQATDANGQVKSTTEPMVMLLSIRQRLRLQQRNWGLISRVARGGETLPCASMSISEGHALNSGEMADASRGSRSVVDHWWEDTPTAHAIRRERSRFRDARTTPSIWKAIYLATTVGASPKRSSCKTLRITAFLAAGRWTPVD